MGENVTKMITSRGLDMPPWQRVGQEMCCGVMRAGGGGYFDSEGA